MKVKVLNRRSICDNQVYDLTTEIEAIKLFTKEKFYIVKKHCQHYKTNRSNNKEIIELL